MKVHRKRCLAAIAILLTACMCGAQAAAPVKDRYIVELKIGIAGEQTSASKLVKPGEPFTVAGWKDGKKWIADFLLTADKRDTVGLTTRFYVDGRGAGAFGTRLQPGGSSYTAVARDDGPGDTVAVIEQSVKLAPKLDSLQRRVP